MDCSCLFQTPKYTVFAAGFVSAWNRSALVAVAGYYSDSKWHIAVTLLCLLFFSLMDRINTFCLTVFAFSASKLLVGCQEEHTVCKN